MHDYFDILGVAPGARAVDIQRACRRCLRAPHPDVHDPEAHDEAFPELVAPSDDAAIDFVDMAPIIERMRAGFFSIGS